MKNEKVIFNQSEALKGFAEHYEDGNSPVWDIGRPKQPFIEIANQVVEPILDAGCGTGDTSIFFASRGLKVIGIDFVENAILRAKSKVEGHNLPVEFMVKDATTLEEWDVKFNTVIDSGLLHAIYDKQKYANGLKHVLNSGGRLFVFYFKDDPSSPGGGISDNELKGIFADGWKIESIKYVSQDTDGWKMNFAIICRIS
jgi:ubiquinone/menaquinone biosynthesis C-methylase UbiE